MDSLRLRKTACAVYSIREQSASQQWMFVDKNQTMNRASKNMSKLQGRLSRTQKAMEDLPS